MMDLTSPRSIRIFSRSIAWPRTGRQLLCRDSLPAERMRASRAESIRLLLSAQARRHVQSGKKLRTMGLGAEGSPALQLEEVRDDGVEE